MTSRVYVVQENPHLDYTDAERFGDVIFITNTEYSDMRNSLSNERVLDDIHKAFTRFDPARDYLLLTGNPITLGYAFHLAMKGCKVGAMRHPLRLLRWDGVTQSYRAVEFRAERD